MDSPLCPVVVSPVWEANSTMSSPRCAPFGPRCIPGLMLWFSLLQSVPGLTGPPHPLHLPEISTCDTTQRSSCTSPGAPGLPVVVASPLCCVCVIVVGCGFCGFCYLCYLCVFFLFVVWKFQVYKLEVGLLKFFGLFFCCEMFGRFQSISWKLESRIMQAAINICIYMYIYVYIPESRIQPLKNILASILTVTAQNVASQSICFRTSFHCGPGLRFLTGPLVLEGPG